MVKVIEKKIALVGEEQGDIKEFDTCWEAYDFYHNIIKKDDRIHNIKDKYIFEFRRSYDNGICEISTMKLYRRGKKLFYKFI